MDSTQNIRAQTEHLGGIIELHQVRPNHYLIYDSKITRVYFAHTKKTHMLMQQLTIEWDTPIHTEDGYQKTTTITMMNTKEFKIRYKNTYQKIDNIPLHTRSRFGWHHNKGKVIKKDYVLARPTYIFTTIGHLEIGGILVRCKPPALLLHTKRTSRIGRHLVNPNICPLMKYLL